MAPRALSALLPALLLAVPALAMTHMPQPRRYSVSVDIGPPRRAIPLPAIFGPRDAALPLVVIDAGHGGHDPGSIAPDSIAFSAQGADASAATPQAAQEKDVTLAIARAVKDKLLETGAMRVALTRDSDRFLALAERHDLARRLSADLLISIHADSAADTKAHGATLYTLSDTPSDAEASRLAERENRSDSVDGIALKQGASVVQAILTDLQQRESMTLASLAVRRIVRHSRAVPFRETPHRFARFVVLKGSETPSLLYETGYLSHEGDRARLTSPAGRQAIADGIAAGLRVYFAERASEPGSS